MSMFETAMDALAWPQEKLKEGVAAARGEGADEREWFSQGDLPTWAYAGGNALLDTFADPLALVPVGLLGKGAKAVGKSAKGRTLAAASNYIDDWYGIDKAIKASKTEEQAMKLARKHPQLKDAPENEVLGAVRKAKGATGWAANAARHSLDALSPSARATYRDTGVSKGVQRNVQQHLDGFIDGTDKKGLSKAMANINYNNHITEQAGRVGSKADALTEVAHRSNLDDYMANTPEIMAEQFKTHVGGGSLSDDAADYAAKHVQDSWGGSPKMVMKQAGAGQNTIRSTGGNHYNDVVYRNAANPDISKIFIANKGTPTLRQLYDGLKGGKQGKYKVKNPSFEDVEKNGLWLTGSKTGTAITEGGINWLTKIEPSGKITGFMSDKHDFLEKLPIAGKALTKALPNDLIAVSPPMFGNIKAVKKAEMAKRGIAVPDEAVRAAKPGKSGGMLQDAEQQELLEEFINTGPNAKTLREEQMIQAGMLSGGALTANKTLNSEEYR